jgi:hypothetical protein
MAPSATTELQLYEARARLGARLSELQRRATHAQALASPKHVLASPWVRIGLGVAAGYLLGRLRTPPAAPRPGAPEGILKAVVRTSLLTLASSAIRAAFAATQADGARPDVSERAPDARDARA